ncbi:MAG: HAMP domain-containing sensor histidine kinase [Bryobacterales bacterium]
MSLVPPSAKPTRFRDLRIRLKLMVLHNLFFLVLACGVYYSVIPLVEQHLEEHVTERSGGVTPKDVLTRAKLQLFAALGAIYVLGVLSLELFVMPRYVYQPIQATLEADEAVQEGDRLSELIPERRIPGDEIGDIMRSRNATVEKLREKELTLERALARLGELAQDLQRKNDQLENARRGMAAQDRLATIGLLSASVAHELNTPLSVIRGTVEKLLETIEQPLERARLERVGRMADRLHRISESLLDFSRVRGEEQRRPAPLHSLLDEAWSLIALDDRAAEVQFLNDVAPDAYALGDYERLMQVFVNLLKNGLYALDGPGVIRASSRHELERGKPFVVVEVDDSGKGIPPDVLPNLFEAFVSTRLDSRGTGLGLTVAEGIVQQHGGQLVAANRPEGGARLTVKLPAATAPVRTETPAEV